VSLKVQLEFLLDCPWR